MDFVINKCYVICLEEFLDIIEVKRKVTKIKSISAVLGIIALIITVGSTLSFYQGYTNTINYIILLALSFLIVISYDILYIRILGDLYVKKFYNNNKNKMLSTTLQVNDDNFIISNQRRKLTLKKDDIYKIVETEKNFIFFENPTKIFGNFAKRALSKEEIEYLSNYKN